MTPSDAPRNERRLVAPRVDLVDPHRFADQASAILRESWEPPCLCYSADYLRWQFQFPGPPAATAVASYAAGEPAGFLALIPRRLRYQGIPQALHLMSFGATRPPHRGVLSVATYRALLLAVRDRALPILSFAESGSPAERMLICLAKTTGYRHQRMGRYPVHAYLPRPGAGSGGVTAEEATDLHEFLAFVARCEGSGTLWNAPDLRQLEHYRNDPRGRVLLLARRPGGTAVGAAMVVLSEAMTRQGTERVAMVDNLFLPEPSAGTLKAILDEAGRCWRDRVTSPVVTVPNPHGIDPALARSIGLRATPSCFNGHLFAPAGSLPWDATGTTLEIV